MMDQVLINELNKLVDELKELVSYHDGLLKYNNKIQQKVNSLIDELGSLTNTFETNIKNESNNIKKELTIIDRNTGKEIELVDIETMAQRVRNINSVNNMYSCIKTLALSNKIAHIYDGKIQSCKNIFIKLYNEIFQNSNIKNITFMESLAINFPELIERDKYNLDMISDKEFNKIWKNLSNNNRVKKDVKISILKQLKIAFNRDDDTDINDKFTELCNNKEDFGSSYLVKKFKEGQYFTKFEDKMFAIKDYYISMIGQLLLSNNQFKNIPYQLVKTDSNTGFDYMLIIDDKDLSYYVEVHMPNFIATELMEIYGMKLEQRTFSRLGASAVYYRDEDEVEKISDALDSTQLDRSTNTRAQIISRDYIHNRSSDDGGGNGPQISGYEFITHEIIMQPSLFEKFLLKDEIKSATYGKLIEESRLNYFNENISLNDINIINIQKYYHIYDNFTIEDKEKFINYSLNELKNGDYFDRKLYDKFNNDNSSYDKIDKISKIIINLNNIKSSFVSNTKELVKSINDNSDNMNLEKYSINNIINKYVDKYIDEEIYNDDIISENNKWRK